MHCGAQAPGTAGAYTPQPETGGVAGVFAGIKKRTSGIVKDISNAVDNRAAKSADAASFKAYMPEYISGRSDEELAEIAYFIISRHKYFSFLLGFNCDQMLSREFSENASFAAIRSAVAANNVSGATDRVIATMNRLLADFSNHPAFEGFKGYQINTGKVLADTIEAALYNEIHKRYSARFGDRATLRDVMQYFSDEELYLPHNAYYLCSFCGNITPHTKSLDFYDSSTSHMFFENRAILNIENSTIGPMNMNDTVVRGDGKTVLIKVVDGVYYEKVKSASAIIRTKQDYLDAVSDLNFAISVDEIDFYKEEGGFQRGPAGPAAGPGYQQPYPQGGPRAVVMYTQRGKRIYSFASLGTFERVLPEKSNDIVKSKMLSSALGNNAAGMMNNGMDGDVVQKFEQLEKLRATGLINEWEYEQKRKALMSSL